MSKEEFNKLWKDSTKEQILNQYYYDYEEMVKSHNTIKEIKSQLEYLETYSSKEDVFEDMKRRLDRIEKIIGENNDK